MPILSFLMVLLAALILPPTPEARAAELATVRKMPQGYFSITLQMQSAPRRELGKRYMEAVLAAEPEFPALVDNLLREQFAVLQRAGATPDFPMAVARAAVLGARLP